MAKPQRHTAWWRWPLVFLASQLPFFVYLSFNKHEHVDVLHHPSVLAKARPQTRDNEFQQHATQDPSSGTLASNQVNMSRAISAELKRLDPISPQGPPETLSSAGRDEQDSREGNADISPAERFVHIVDTRFMQTETDSRSLGRARVLLFQTFCLPSVISQTVQSKSQDSPPFLWIIRIAPELDPNIRKSLVELVRPYSFVFLVESFQWLSDGWLDILDVRAAAQSQSIYAGDVELLKQARRLRESRAVLVTLLDPHDGLRSDALARIQKDAAVHLQLSVQQEAAPPKSSWRMWCAASFLAWRATDSRIEEESKLGIFALRDSPCMTAGKTLGLSAGVSASVLPPEVQDQAQRLESSRPGSADIGAPCVGECVALPDLVFAIRSVASAEMDLAPEAWEHEALMAASPPLDGGGDRLLKGGSVHGFDFVKRAQVRELAAFLRGFSGRMGEGDPADPCGPDGAGCELPREQAMPYEDADEEEGGVGGAGEARGRREDGGSAAWGRLDAFRGHGGEERGFAGWEPMARSEAYARPKGEGKEAAAAAERLAGAMVDSHALSRFSKDRGHTPGFIPAARFEGAKPGYVFRGGASGKGYYPTDTKAKGPPNVKAKYVDIFAREIQSIDEEVAEHPYFKDGWIVQYLMREGGRASASMEHNDVSFPECAPSSSEKPLLLILVLSRTMDADVRAGVRSTYGSPSITNLAPLSVRLVFVLGNLRERSAALQAEMAEHGDLLVGDFHDTYRNLTLKVRLGLEWALDHCPAAKWIAKVDDDVLVHVPLLAAFLHAYGQPMTLYGKLAAHNPPKRDANATNLVTREEYPVDAAFPTFALGPSYVLARDAAQGIMKVWGVREPLPVEDVYVTGILAYYAGVKKADVTNYRSAQYTWEEFREAADRLTLYPVSRDTFASVLPARLRGLVHPSIAARFQRRTLEVNCRYKDVKLHTPGCGAGHGIVQWSCHKGGFGTVCGGAGNQMAGIASTYMHALSIGYDFSVEWTKPVDMLSEVLVAQPALQCANAAFERETEKPQEFQLIDGEPFDFLPSCEWRQHRRVVVKTNRFSRPSGACDRSNGSIAEWALHASPVGPHRGLNVGCVFWRLFALSDALARAVEQELLLLRQFASDRVGVVAVHIRMGDRYMGVGDDARPHQDLAGGMSLPHLYVRCAFQLADRLGLPNATIYVLSDVDAAKKEAASVDPARVFASTRAPVHVDRTSGGAGGQLEATLQTWSDVLLASLSHGLVHPPAPSTFSQLAADIGRFAQGTTIGQEECQQLLGQPARGSTNASLLPKRAYAAVRAGPSPPPALRVLNPLSQEAACTATTVTCYYPLGHRSKHSPREYSQWIAHGFMQYRACFVVFVPDTTTMSFLLELMPQSSAMQIRFVVLAMESFNVSSMLDESGWDHQHSLDGERDIHFVELYKIWLEKAFMVQRVIGLNPFSSTYFLWLDIGHHRGRLPPLLASNFPNEALLASLPSDQVWFCAVSPFEAADFELDQDNFAVKSTIPSQIQRTNRLAGGYFGGTAAAILRYVGVLSAELHGRMARGLYVGKDQALYNSIAVSTCGLVCVVQAPEQSASGVDPWVFMPYYLAGLHPTIPCSPASVGGNPAAGNPNCRQ